MLVVYFNSRQIKPSRYAILAAILGIIIGAINFELTEEIHSGCPYLLISLYPGLLTKYLSQHREAR